MATRTISGTLDTFEHEGSEITYKGSTDACDRSENIRGFQVNPGGYTGFSNVEQNGKGKGAVGMTVSNAAKNYLVILKTDGYSEVSFGGTVDVP